MSIPTNTYPKENQIPEDVIRSLILPFKYHLDQIDIVKQKVNQETKDARLAESRTEYLTPIIQKHRFDAIKRGHLSGLTYLLHQYKSIEHRFIDYLSHAVYFGQLSIVQYLFHTWLSNNNNNNNNNNDDDDYTASFHISESDFRELLQIAILHRHVHILKYLCTIRNKHDDNNLMICTPNMLDRNLNRLLVTAGTIEMVNIILQLVNDNGKHVCNKLVFFDDAIQDAFEFDKIDMVKYLCELLDNDGKCIRYQSRVVVWDRVFREATNKGHIDVIEYLCKLTDSDGKLICDPSVSDSRAIRFAAKNGHMHVVKYLCELVDNDGKLVCDPSANGNYALIWAAEFGHLNVVKYLCELVDNDGNFVCDPTSMNNHAILGAAKNGHLDVVRYLCGLVDKNGKFVCSPFANDNIAITRAENNGHIEVVEYLSNILR